MLKITEKNVKSILSKTKLGSDFVINPYTGCMHKCVYCYARFMQKYSNHNEPWGSFLDIKINAPELIKNDAKHARKSILISSVTDPYQPIETRYQLTRKILKKLIPLQSKLQIITKSDLVLRNMDLLKQFKNCEIAISLSCTDESLNKQLEPLAASPTKRINALKQLRENSIKTIVFISPIFPGVSDWKNIVKTTKSFVDEYWFENLNLYYFIKNNVYNFLKKNNPQLIKVYDEIYSEKITTGTELNKKPKNFAIKKKSPGEYISTIKINVN
jgi:DNA repair photolyase